jgi:DNA polymerase family B, exonuclease domain
MSPTKRAFPSSCYDNVDEEAAAAAAQASWTFLSDPLSSAASCTDPRCATDNDDADAYPFVATVPPKRLRGGGNGDDFDDGDLLLEPPGDEPSAFDDDDAAALLMMEEDIVEEEYIPPEAMEEARAAAAAVLTDKQRWERPPLDRDTTATNRHDLDFQWLDMDVVSGNALSANPNRAKSKVVGQSGSGIQVPILRTFGVTNHGHSVCAFIHGFTPYAYFAVPAGCVVDESRLSDMRSELTERLQSSVRMGNKDSVKVVGIALVKDHKSIFGYETPYNLFLKIYVSLDKLVPALRRIMEEGISLPGVDSSGAENGGGMMPQFAAFEANVPFVLRFMVDRDIAGAGWLTLPQNAYQIRSADRRETHCQVRETRTSRFWCWLLSSAKHFVSPVVLLHFISSAAGGRHFVRRRGGSQVGGRVEQDRPPSNSERRH